MGLSKNCKPNNPAGRPVGATGKVSLELKEWMRKVVEDNQEQFILDLKSLEPKERIAILEKLFSYIVPKAPPAKELDENNEAREKILIAFGLKKELN